MGRVPFPAWLPTVSGEPRVAWRVRLFSASYKTLCSRNAVQSIFKPFPFRDLQIPFSATPLFCHLYKTPGCHPSTLLWATAWQRQCATLFSFSPRPNLSLAVPKNATYNLPSPISGAHHMAVAKKSKSQKSASKPNGKPKSAPPEPKGHAPLANNASTKDAQPKPVVPKDNEAQIAVHWKEEECFLPSPKFIGQANLNDPDFVKRFSEENFPECFRDYAELLDWDQYWHTTLDTGNPP